MSSGDPSTVPSSTATPIPDSKVLPSSQQTEANEQDEMSPDSSLNVEPSTEKAIFSISDSDLQLNELSMGPSISDSIENMTPITIRGEVTSLDAISLDEEVGELLKREAKSAFEITEFRPNPDELDKSMNRHPVSTESLQIVKGESGGSEESMTAVIAVSSGGDEKQHTLDIPGKRSQQSAPNRPKFVIGTKDPGSVEAPLEALEDGASQGGVTSSPKTMVISDDPTAGKMSPHPSGSAPSAPSANGSSVQPNRFRRVNLYERGRWTVRDSLVTEEAAVKKQQETSSEVVVGASNDTPPLPVKATHHQQQRSDSTTDTTSHLQPTLTEFNTLSNVGMGIGILVGGGGGAGIPSGAESTSDKDSSSIHMDRNSTAADTLSLSRNTSMSSIIATEKSIDGDEILGDIDMESVGGGVITNSAPISGSQTQNPVQATMTGNDILMAFLPTSSSGSVPLPSASSTTVSRDDQSATPASTSNPAAAPGLE